MRSPRHLIVRVLLAAALLFAQQVGSAHAVSHGSAHAATHEHGKGLPVQGCDDCLGFAQVEGAPGCAFMHAQAAMAFAIAGLTPPCDWTPVLAIAFSPRGPPRLP